MYRSWIERQRSEEDGLNSTEASALQEYLDLKLNVDAAAIQITTAFTAEGSHGLSNLWFNLLDIAQEFPDQQEQLVRLFLAITKIPDRAEGASSPTTSDDKSDEKSNLKYFGWEIRDRWNCKLLKNNKNGSLNADNPSSSQTMILHLAQQTEATGVVYGSI